VDPNASLYGVWYGALNMSFPGTIYRIEPIFLAIRSNSVAFYRIGMEYPVASYSLSDPNLTVNVNLNFLGDPNGVLVNMTGTRSGETLNGTATAPAAGGTGTWAATKTGIAAQSTQAGRSIAQMLKP
jgi:hypothetical protein